MNVGIDLGSTYSLIARLEPDGTPTLVPDSSDPRLVHTPSAVYIGDRTAIVGHLVETMAEQDPELTILRFFKRQFGETKPIYFDPRGSAWYAESVAALVIRKLMFDAENFVSAKLTGAVITVPAHFNDVQRKAVLVAAGLADLPVLALLEEPVAAALHYGVTNRAHNQVILVYDFGGGTFDATVLSLDAKGVYVLAKEGMTNLGGKEFDEKIGKLIIERFERTGLSPRTDARTLLQLRRASEEIKIELCMPNKTAERRVVMLGPQSAEVRISRADFEREIAVHIAETEEVTRRCVAGAGLQLRDIDAVLLVGGTSMVPAVGDRVRHMMGSMADRVKYHDPMRSVAYGAAIHTAQVTGQAERYSLPPELRGVTGYHVGVRVVDPRTGQSRIDPLIKKNMPLPARAQKTYYTNRADQQRIVLDIVQYQSGAEDAVRLGKLSIGPLPSPRQNYPVDIEIENRTDGTVSVRAFDPQTHAELQQTFKREANDVFDDLANQRMLVKNTVINNI